jgi:chromosome segregation ATPase
VVPASPRVQGTGDRRSGTWRGRESGVAISSPNGYAQVSASGRRSECGRRAKLWLSSARPCPVGCRLVVPGKLQPCLDLSPSRAPKLTISRIQPKRSRVEELEEELRHLQNVFDAYKQQTKNSIGETGDKAAALESLSNAHNEYLQDKKAWEKDRNNLLLRIADREQKLDACQQECREVRDELDLAQSTITVTQAFLEDAREETERESKLAHRLQTALDKFEEEDHEQMDTSFTTASTDVQELKSEHERKIEALKFEYTSKIQEMKDAHENQIQGIEADHVDEVQRTIAAYEADQDKYNDEAEKLKNAHAEELRKANEARQEFEKDLQKRYGQEFESAMNDVKSQAETENKKLHATIEDLQIQLRATVQDFQNKLQEANDETARQQDSATRFKTELYAKADQNGEAMGKLQSVHTELESKEKYIFGLEQDIVGITKTKEDLESTIQSQVEEARSTFSQLQDNIKRLETELEGAQGDLDRAASENKQLEIELATSKQALKHTNMANEDLERKNDDLRNLQAQQQDEVKTKSSEVERLKTKETDLNRAIEDSKAELDEFKREYAKTSTAIEDLYRDVAALEEDQDAENLMTYERVKALNEAITKISRDLSQAQDAKRVSEQEIEQLKRKLAAAEQPAENTLDLETALHMDDGTESVDEPVATVDQATNTDDLQSIVEIRELQEKVGALEETNRAHVTDLDTMRQEKVASIKTLEKLRQEKTTAEEEKAASVKSLEELRQEKATAEEVKAASIKSLEELRQQIESLTQANLANESQLGQLREQTERLQQTNADLEKEKRASAKTSTTLRKQNTDLKQENDRLEEENEDVHNSFSDLHKRINKLENDKADFERAWAILEKAKQDADRDAGSLREHIADLEKKNETGVAELEKLFNQVGELEQQHTVDDHALSDLGDQVANLLAANEKLETERNGLREKLVNLEEQLKDLEKRSRATIHELKQDLKGRDSAYDKLMQTDARAENERMRKKIESLSMNNLAAENKQLKQAVHAMDDNLIEWMPGYKKGDGLKMKPESNTRPTTPKAVNANATIVAPITTIDVAPHTPFDMARLHRVMVITAGILGFLLLGVWSGFNSLRAFYMAPNRLDTQSLFASDLFASASPFEPMSLLGIFFGVPLGLLQWFLGAFIPSVGPTKTLFPNALLVWAVCALILSQVNVQAMKKMGIGAVLACAVLFGLYRQAVIDEMDYMPYYTTAYLGS